MKNGFSSAALAVFLLSGCVSDRPQEAKNAYESDYERVFQNVLVKEKTPHYVTYEYKDVRIDEIAFLASRYSQEQGGKTAYLHDTVLYRNFTRRATFDCLELQN